MSLGSQMNPLPPGGGRREGEEEEEPKQRKRPVRKGWIQQKTPLRSKKPLNGRVWVPASEEQRAQVRLKNEPRTSKKCFYCGLAPVDPMHVPPRKAGGCDDKLCVLWGCRSCHDAYDGRSKRRIKIITPLLYRKYQTPEVLDDLPRTFEELLPMLRKEFRPVLAHALTHIDYPDLRVALVTTSKAIPELEETGPPMISGGTRQTGQVPSKRHK